MINLHNPKILAVAVLSFSIGLALLNPPKIMKEAPIKQIHSPKMAENNLPEFANKGIEYLVKVQFPNGGWGAGTHANQQMVDATKVQIDPATTAFSAMALLRSGNTLQSGPYQENLLKALECLLLQVENSPKNSPSITQVRGTQPQIKLGQNIDASMCVQFFIRVKSQGGADQATLKRIDQAIETCLLKIKSTQNADGSITGGGWAPVLQSAMANNALELAFSNGYDVDEEELEKAREYQSQNVGSSGDVKTERGAGVALYSVASTQRSSARKAQKAQALLDKAKKEGKIAKNDTLSRENLNKLNLSAGEAEELYLAYEQNQMTATKMNDDQILAGFGNNGGEEFLSFMMTSESLVITGGEPWVQWKNKMNSLLSEIQNQDGSWNGHHCITSPVFCTAACILALSAENDRELLLKERDSKE